MKIDLVYLWVDGNDKKWMVKKNAALKKMGRAPMKDAAATERFRDNEELRYSLRSVIKFAPWINHIYIITDGQRPDWLKDDSKITIVDHSEIIPAQFLPTFNSSLIEMFLQNIPNLSEHFIYSNDDMFFGRHTKPDFFFDSNGDPIVIVKERFNPAYIFSDKKTFDKKMANKKQGRKIIVNGIRFAFLKTGIKRHIYMSHAMEPMRKSYLNKIMSEFGNEIIADTATTFRDGKNINRMVFSLIQNALHLNTLVLNYRFGEKRIVCKNETLIAKLLRKWRRKLFGAKYDLFDRSDLNKMRQLDPAMICINDIGKNTDEMQMFLQEKFPEKSEFESDRQTNETCFSSSANVVHGAPKKNKIKKVLKNKSQSFKSFKSNFLK